MEIVTFLRTIAEFAEYSLSFLYTELPSLLSDFSGVPSWFLTCCSLSVGVALMCKVWR